MNVKEQAVYDASLKAAYRLGYEGGCDGDLSLAILEAPEVSAVMPKWGVGNLPPTTLSEWRRAYESGLVAYEFEASKAYLDAVKT